MSEEISPGLKNFVLKNVLLDISCLTRDRVVHHTLRYKRRFHGDVSK